MNFCVGDMVRITKCEVEIGNDSYYGVGDVVEICEIQKADRDRFYVVGDKAGWYWLEDELEFVKKGYSFDGMEALL